jgi:hypothetical protein
VHKEIIASEQYIMLKEWNDFMGRRGKLGSKSQTLSLMEFIHAKNPDRR